MCLRQEFEGRLLKIEFFKVEIVNHAAKPRQIVMTLDHFRQFVVDERRGQDRVEMSKDHRVQFRRKCAEKEILRIQSLRQSLRIKKQGQNMSIKYLNCLP